ncbi:MAG: 2-oxoacid:acceptor oxidoreductase family protein [Candidatus Aminicenantia bacterium]
MIEHYEIRYSAIGGQGIITAGAILAEAIVHYENKYATQSPTYTSQVRGGPTKVDVIIDKDEIIYPYATAIDFYLSTGDSPFHLYLRDVKEDAIIVVDSNLVKEFETKKWRVHRIPIIEATKRKIGNIVVTSVVALAITVKLTNIISEESLKKAVLKMAPKGTESMNLEAIELGYELISGK